MSRRRGSRRRRRKKSKKGMGDLGGLSPKQMQKALGQIDTDEIDDVTEVIVKTKDKEIVLENPEVTIMNMGQEIWNIVPNGKHTRPLGSSSTTKKEPTKSKEIEIKDDDVNLIMNTVDVPREKAINAIKENDGDIAAAIMSLQE